MSPSNKRRSLDGVSRPTKQPEYRYDHELPAPKPVTMIREAAPVDHIVTPDAPEVATQTSAVSSVPVVQEQSIGQGDKKPHKRPLWKWLFGILLAIMLMCAAIGAYAYSWYQTQLTPVTEDTTKRVRVTIVSGSTPEIIAQQLQDAGVVRNELAFRIHTKLTGTQNNLKAGTYSLQPSISTPAIVEHLVSGKQDTFTIMFRPGETLMDTRKALAGAGFSDADISAALSKAYDRPLFEGKPASADLEGYIFGDTYEFTLDVTVETVLNRTFDEFEAYIEENKLIEAYKKHDLTLYQGITLASIIQKEVAGLDDSKQVAQVFYKRLAEGISLGADATFVYAAKKAGKQPTVTFDSPYNTRTHKGLPPGPISAPGVNALLAVAQPATGDYLYFVSGDDGKNYFSRTLAEHEANTRKYCVKNCALF